MKDMILSLSGGLDSSSLLFEFKDEIMLAVSFDYGSNQNRKEQECAKLVCEKANVPWQVIDLKEVFKGFNSALLQGADAVPQGEYDKSTIKSLVVPFRNGIFLSVLGGLADSMGAKRIALASHAGDHAIYRDCTEAFSNAMHQAIKLGTDNEIEFFCPYVNIDKKEIARRGIAHGLNPDWTYSCYTGNNEPCGQCPTCKERAWALEGLSW